MKFEISPVAAPICEDDDVIREALEEASIPALMMSMVHMMGDVSLLDGPIRPGTPALYEIQGNIPEADKAALRKQALEVVSKYRDAGCPVPEALPREVLAKMMEFSVSDTIEPRYVDMFLEELGIHQEDLKLFRWNREVASEEKEAFRVVIIGAGMSGLLAAIQLDLAGIPYQILEKNPEVGGTWYENSYPGCRVDTPSHFYSYSFEQSDDWPGYFPTRGAMLSYFKNCADTYGLREKTLFNTEVTAAVYDEEEKHWTVRYRTSGGSEERTVANVVISAVGQLNRPKIPDFKGVENFAGPAFHSAKWEDHHELKGKKIALVGTGASAFQLGPELAKEAEALYVFQRSPAWMFPNSIYHEEVSEGHKWLLKHLPYYARWLRFLLFQPGSDQAQPGIFIDESWEHPERSMNAVNDQMREALTEWIRSQVGHDPELFEKVLPKYPPFGKRLLQDNGTWLKCLALQNVEVVTDGIDEITPHSIRTEAGNEYEVDVIIYATGFAGSKFLHPMEITGVDGTILSSLWDEDPKAYLGISIPKFPNFFCLYGPSTNLGTAGTIVILAEFQVRYVMEAIKLLLENGYRAMDCKEAVNTAYNEKLRDTSARTVWEHPAVTSHYQNRHGRNVLTMPWRLADYREWTMKPNPDDYDLES